METNQKKVVIVEDEPDTAEMLAEMLRVEGFRVLASHASVPAITLISANIPDLVILDIMMPDISGLEVLKFMQRDPKLAKIPVVVVSAKSQPSDITTGLNAGASAYLTKPVGFADFKQTVEKVLARAAAF